MWLLAYKQAGSACSGVDKYVWDDYVKFDAEFDVEVCDVRWICVWGGERSREETAGNFEGWQTLEHVNSRRFAGRDV